MEVDGHPPPLVARGLGIKGAAQSRPIASNRTVSEKGIYCKVKLVYIHGVHREENTIYRVLTPAKSVPHN